MQKKFSAKNIPAQYRLFLVLSVLSLLLIHPGCENATNSFGSSSIIRPATTATISGTVTSNQLRANLAKAAEINGLSVAGARIWLEEKPEIRCISNSDGSFLLENVPPGNWHVVADFYQGNSLLKQRSAVISITNESKNIGSLAIIEADRRIRGKISNSDGFPAAGIVMSLWGETFQSDIDGSYISPPIPPGLDKVTVRFVNLSGLMANDMYISFPLSGVSLLDFTLAANGAAWPNPLINIVSTRSEISPLEEITVFAELIAAAGDPTIYQNLIWSASHNLGPGQQYAGCMGSTG
jgi:hypothetical protein